MRMFTLFIAVLFAAAVSCGNDEVAPSSSGSSEPLIIGGIPDQDLSLLEERFGGMAAYLEETVGIEIEYRPATSYVTLVTAFQSGDVQLSWFGGLTGVQARKAAAGSNAILQRPRDIEFHSVFVVGANIDANSLADLTGKSFTFGSESSTSGHLMPRWYLSQAGIVPEEDFQGQPSYSGSHDTTWKLVESGSFNAGALNATVWDRAVSEGQVDTSKARVLERVGPYFDYHWVAHSSIDETYGDGTTDRIRTAMLEMDMNDPEQARLLGLFETERFIDTQNDNYTAIEETARQLGLIE